MKNLIYLFWLISFNSFAQEEVLPLCHPEIKVNCITSKGFVFEKVENGWKDLQGKTWYDGVLSDIEQDAAAKYCKDLGRRLPTDVEYEIAEKHGFAEVLTRMNTERYWSCTPNPERNQVFLTFHGDGGYVFGWWEGYLLQGQCVDK